jgi:hypothetical protein
MATVELEAAADVDADADAPDEDVSRPQEKSDKHI